MELEGVGEEFENYKKIERALIVLDARKTIDKQGNITYRFGGADIKVEDIWKSANRIRDLQKMGYDIAQAIYYGANETEYFGQMFSFFLANDALAPPLKDTGTQEEVGFFTQLFKDMRDWFVNNVLTHLPGPWVTSIKNQPVIKKDKEGQWKDLLNRRINSEDLKTVSDIFRNMLGSDVYKLVKEHFKDPSEAGIQNMQGSYVEDAIEDIFINDTKMALDKIPSNKLKSMMNKNNEYNTKGLMKALIENGASQAEMNWVGISDVLENRDWIDKDEFDDFVNKGIVSETIWKYVGLGLGDIQDINIFQTQYQLVER